MTGANFTTTIVPTGVQAEVRRTGPAPLGTVRVMRFAPRRACHRDHDQQAAGETLASCAHSTGRQTKYRAAEAIARQSAIPGNASEPIRRGFVATSPRIPVLARSREARRLRP